MSYNIHFSMGENPQTFYIFLNAVNRLREKNSGLYTATAEELHLLFEREFNLKLSGIRQNDGITKYTASFKSKQDYTLFILRWS